MNTLAQPTIPASCFDLMRELRANNTREWFAANKDAYLKELAFVEAFADAMLQELNSHDLIETPSGKRSLYRIYRDVRFSKDKTPFSTYWGGRFKRAGKQRRGGYYFHFEPGDKSFVLCGFWAPSPADLKLIREDIAFDAHPLPAIHGNKTFIDSFGTLQGDQLKTSPKGYDAAHEAINLLRYKQYLVIRRFTDAEVLHPNFLRQAGQAFHNMRPFLNYMSEVLAGDGNGAVG
jgi:uncharacterized protein (TIGR02453 family)